MNAYPELPVLPYVRTSVPMTDPNDDPNKSVVGYLKSSSLPIEVKRSTYVIFRIESANGKSGINNNYSGMQADGARWDASVGKYFVGTTTAPENQTGKTRIFLCFAKWQDCVACLADRLAARGLYVGGKTHRFSTLDVDQPVTLVRAYLKEWVTGSAEAEPTDQMTTNFLSMYTQAEGFFTEGETPVIPAPVVVPTPPTPPFLDTSASLRVALTDIIARAQAALAGIPDPGRPSSDNSADDLNAQVLSRIADVNH